MTLYLIRLLKRSNTTFLELVRIMLPIMIVVRVGEDFGLPDTVGGLLEPAMSLAGLPGAAGIVWAVCLLTGLYGGIGAYLSLLPYLDMTLGQHNALCAMMLFAHALPLEQAIVSRAGASFAVTSLLRIGAALSYAALVAFLCAKTAFYSAPLDIAFATSGASPGNWTSWFVDTGQSMLGILLVISLLYLLLDFLEAMGVMRWIVDRLQPALRMIGIDSALAPMTTIGLLLGLTYGGALIIQASQSRQFDNRSRLLALSCLSLSHSLIEDTALMLAIGADIWIVLVGRLAFTLIIIAAMSAMLVNPRNRVNDA